MLHRESSAPITSYDTTGRRITVQLCRWCDPRDVHDVTPSGVTRYREAFPIDSIDLLDRVYVVDRHHGEQIGHVDVDSYDATGDGPTVDVILSRSADADRVLALIESGTIDSVSMELAPVEQTERDGVVWRTRSTLHGVAFAFRPAHDAPILATRETPTPTPEVPNMSDQTPTVPDRPAVNPDPAPAVELAELVTPTVLTRSLDELRDELTRTILAQPSSSPTPTLVHRSLGEYAEAVWANPGDQLLRRALADQITANNPGVVPPGWLQTVAGILDFGRPTVSAFGVSGLPDTGMDVNWPYFDGDLSALVGQQATEKTAITSTRVDLLKGTAAIRTYAGGSDISYQLIRRSGPAYLTSYLRIMMLAYAVTTNAAASSAAVAAAVDGDVPFDPATGTLDELLAALYSASIAVESATGVPASFVLCASDTFAAVGTLAAQAPMSDARGTGDQASQLAPNVSGLRIVHDRSLPAGSVIVSNGEAAEWHEDGPFTVSAEDVEKLGQNVAVWGMGAFAGLLPAGIVSIPATAPAAAARTAKS